MDDEIGVRESFRMILKDKYNVLCVDSPDRCMNILKNEKIDLVFMDVRMPDGDGIETLKKIKEVFPDLPVVIITGVGTHQIAIEALKFGASNLVAKPIKVENIIEVTEEILSKTKKIENGSVEEILKNEYLDALKALSKIIETRDPYTREHSERVTKYAIDIAREMGFSEEEIEVLRQSSLLHDIGKVGISDIILCKQGKLSPEEKELIRKHPEIGEEILKPLKLLHIAQPLIRYHHERYDGQGYPDGLSGEEIPIYARILAVADSYDAMISERPYRKSLSHEEAVKELIRNSGTQYDPKIVDVFINKVIRKYNKNLEELEEDSKE